MEISNSSSCAHELQGFMDDLSFFHQWTLGDLGPVSLGSPFEDLHHAFSDMQPEPDREQAPESMKYQSNKPLKHLIGSSTSTDTFRFSDTNHEGISWPKMETWTLDFHSQSVVSESSFGINKNPESKPLRSVGANSRPKDNVLAERKRRQKLSQRFIDLCALVPGLKKMDKDSILGDAIKYTKQLQERVKTLEHQNKKKSIESVSFVKKHLHCSENSDSSDQKISVPIDTAEPLPEIEARFSDDLVLIKIQCEKRNGLLEKTVAEIEKLHLSVVSSSAMTFGDSALYMVVTAKKEEDSTTNTKELVKNLCAALKTHLIK